MKRFIGKTAISKTLNDELLITGQNEDGVLISSAYYTWDKFYENFEVSDKTPIEHLVNMLNSIEKKIGYYKYKIQVMTWNDEYFYIAIITTEYTPSGLVRDTDECEMDIPIKEIENFKRKSEIWNFIQSLF